MHALRVAALARKLRRLTRTARLPSLHVCLHGKRLQLAANGGWGRARKGEREERTGEWEEERKKANAELSLSLSLGGGGRRGAGVSEGPGCLTARHGWSQ